MTGSATSNNIPHVDAFQATNKGNGDAFITAVDFAATRFEESNSAIQYSGTWPKHASLAHSGGAARLAVNPGARATFTFTGPTAKWIAFRDPWAGIAKVYVDGVFKQEIDTYASPQMAQAVMFTVTGLGPGAHSLVVEVAGRRNPASLGNWVWVDAFDVSTASDGSGTGTGSGAGGSGTGGENGGGTIGFIRVEQTNSMVVHTGSWSTVQRTFFSGGSATLAAASGARATFTFSGTQARWIGFKDSYAGIAKIYIDGVPKAEVDTYSHESQANVVLFTTAMLTAGTHTLTIEATATRNASSGGNWIWVDAFESNSSESASFTLIDQTGSAVAYNTSWSTVSRTFFSGGSAAAAKSAGDRATFTFTGTKARWIGFKDSYAGIVKVYVDGVLQTEIDTYAFTSQAKVALYATPTLASGTHTLTIEATGTRNAASLGNWVWVDAFEFAD